MANEAHNGPTTPHQMQLMNMSIGMEDENSSNQMYDDVDDDIESGKL